MWIGHVRPSSPRSYLFPHQVFCLFHRHFNLKLSGGSHSCTGAPLNVSRRLVSLSLSLSLPAVAFPTTFAGKLEAAPEALLDPGHHLCIVNFYALVIN